jgi:hypothetical protein
LEVTTDGRENGFGAALIGYFQCLVPRNRAKRKEIPIVYQRTPNSYEGRPGAALRNLEMVAGSDLN